MQNISSSLGSWRKVVAALNDEALVDQARACAMKEREQTAWLVAHLAEIHSRELGFKRGCSDTVRFACKFLGLSDRMAWDRVTAARLALQLPDTIEKIASGELSLCAAKALWSTIAQTEKTPAKSGVNSIAPALALEMPVAPAPVVAKPTMQEKRELFSQVLGKPHQESIRFLETWKCERAGVKALPKPRPHSSRKYDGGGWNEVRLYLSDAELTKLDRIRDLLSHKLGSRDPHAALEWMVEACLDKVDPHRQEARKEKREQRAKAKQNMKVTQEAKPEARVILETESAPEANREEMPAANAEQNAVAQPTETTSDTALSRFAKAARQQKYRRIQLPAWKRRRTLIRFHGACQHQDPKSGNKCGSTAFVDVDHIIEICRGGTNDESNLTLSCASHNRRRYFWPAEDQPTYALGR